jgi:hypothetical protein
MPQQRGYRQQLPVPPEALYRAGFFKSSIPVWTSRDAGNQNILKFHGFSSMHKKYIFVKIPEKSHFPDPGKNMLFTPEKRAARI